MNFKAVLKAGAAAAAIACAFQISAAEFVVPVHYSVELVDGETSEFDFNKDTRAINLSAGRHQIVLLFEDTFGTSANRRLVQASNPIVVEITNIPADGSYTFDYPEPRGLEGAENYARTQKITLTQTSGKPLAESEAYYYILASESGFSILRDYRQDLMSLNRLYAPKYVQGSNRTVGMTSYGAPTITADTFSNPGDSSAAANVTMAAPMTTAAQDANLTTSSTSGGAVSGPSPQLRQLVSLYESADAETKLQFVKYVMSH